MVISQWNFYDGNGNEIKGAIAKGIDVSYHNGDIDWAKVKAAGISFALLRCGYGNDERNQDDIKFVQNVKVVRTMAFNMEFICIHMQLTMTKKRL